MPRHRAPRGYEGATLGLKIEVGRKRAIHHFKIVISRSPSLTRSPLQAKARLAQNETNLCLSRPRVMEEEIKWTSHLSIIRREAAVGDMALSARTSVKNSNWISMGFWADSGRIPQDSMGFHKGLYGFRGIPLCETRGF